MGEEIYKFKDKVNNIPVPELQLDIVIEQAIRKTEGKPKRSRYMIAIAATTLFLLTGSAFVSPIMANVLSQIPLLGNVLSYFDKGLEDVSKKGLVTTVGETAVDRDIPITITEVYYDNFRLVVGYSIPLPADKNQYEALKTEVEMLINDKKVLGVSSHGSINENQLIGTIETTANLPDELKLEIMFNDVLDKKGNWHFEIPVSRINDSLVYEINTVTKTEDYKFELFDIQLSPSGTRIHMELDTPLGQEENYSFLVYTDSGEELKLINYNEKKTIPLFKFEKQVVKAIALYEPLKGSKLKIVPVFDPFENPLPMKDLTMEVDLTKIKGSPIENDSTNIGLTDNWVDPDTFMRDYMIEEAAEDLKIELGEYMKADLTILDFGFYSNFYKEQNLNSSKTVLKPVALIEEVEYPNEYENAIIIYKTEDGKNHIFKASNKEDEWKIIESEQWDGRTIEELEKMYHEKYE